MYQLADKFNLYDSNLIPHTLFPERHTATENLHASVDERGFVLKSIGNRWVLKTPLLKDFSLKFTFSYTFLKEYNPCTNIFFGYDVRNRIGQGISFKYNLCGSMEVSLINVNRMHITQISEKIAFSDFHINENENTDVSITTCGNFLKGTVGGRGFSFDIEPMQGNIALERKNFVGEWIIKEINVTSAEKFPTKTILPNQKVKIPMREGGDIPYEFTYKAEKIGNQSYLFIQLGGGTATRALNREDRPGQYVAEQDKLTSPFVILRNGEDKKEFNLYHGTKTICDPNIYWDCLKEYFNHPELPICAVFPINESDITENTTISFGYKELCCTGFMAQSGGPSEFIFDKNGVLLYEGEKLCESVFELYSPADKFATTLIPKNTYHRDDVIHHLAVNHYFHIDENISLTMSLKSKLPLEYFKVEAQIRDVYDSEILSTLSPEISTSNWKFGYSELSAKVHNAPLPLGVYRIVFTVCYGDSIYKTYNKVFEVFDKDAKISPAKASGLPFTFSMPNEQKWLASNTFDLWNPKPSCDEIHFISCVTNTPVEAEKQRIWELAPIFGREWFAWLNDRTCLDWSIESHIETVKNSDYLYIDLAENLPPYPEIYLINIYQDPKFRKLLHEFLEKNPEIAKKIKYTPNETEEEFTAAKPIDESEKSFDYTAFTYDNLKNLLETCHSEWFNFANGRFLEMAKAQNKEIKKINPKFKRAFYGPLCQYYTATVSYHSIKCYGATPDNTMAEDVFTGFSVFEDYPASCAYQTYRGAFAAMTILLHCPDFVMYPEQYSGSNGGCIDGAVKFAHAPMGKYDMPLYFNSTHAFEYVFNTPHRAEDGYHYWTSYGFHRADHSPEMADRLTRDWKIAIDNKPLKPLRTMAMVTEYVDEEDVFDGEILTLHGYTGFSNISEEAHGYIYDCNREAGLNAPFALKSETLSSLRADECDALVLPTLKFASDETISEIRRLYESGVSLIAVSDICGLEDIFGVKENNQNVWITELCTDKESELIYPNKTPLKYEADGAEAIISAENGLPVILKKGRALLINAPVSKLGHECFEGREGKTKNNVSELLKKTLKEEILKLSSPLVLGENVGVTLFESEKGNTQLLAIDYSAYDNREFTEREAVIKINFPVKEALSEREFTSVRNKDGSVKEIRFNIKPHEAVMFRLRRDDL
ncbi:MAG: hypothetical protein IKA17_01080 [Clostridia bacterium]|nr:hypothetical protein [Clostridia bacterium]